MAEKNTEVMVPLVIKFPRPQLILLDKLVVHLSAKNDERRNRSAVIRQLVQEGIDKRRKKKR